MLTLSWMKCVENQWCSFDALNLSKVTEKGVYIIWHAGNPGRVVYVGQGDVANRIAQHRLNTAITSYQKFGALHVTWAAVPAAQRDGVERYLADQWSPLVGDAHPDCYGIAVNSPW